MILSESARIVGGVFYETVSKGHGTAREQYANFASDCGIVATA